MGMPILLEPPVDNLQHARWRVKFRESLWLAHLATTKNGVDWFHKEAEYRQWVMEARGQLSRMALQESSAPDVKTQTAIRVPAEG